MGRTADVIVVGGGIIGCAVARELGRRGAKVRIFEMRTLGAGATQASAGVLAPLIEGHDRGPWLEMGVRSLAMYDDFVASAAEQSGLPIEFRRCGTMQVADAEEVAQMVRAPDIVAHPSDQRWLTTEEARTLEPALRSEIGGAVLTTRHGYVRVAALTDALAWTTLRYGAQIETGCRVVTIAADRRTMEVVTSNGSRWSASDVILATGSWSAQAGLPEPAAAAVRPVRGQLLRMAWTAAQLSHVIWGTDCYFVPWLDGSVLVGATVEDVGFDERTTAAGVRDLLEAACALLPDAWRATFLEARVGLRPATADGFPIIGRSDLLPGLVYATGHYRNGILLAPLTALLVADLITESKSDPILTLTSPARFR